MAKTKKETTKKEKVTKTIEKKPRVAKQTMPVPEMVMSVLTKNRDGITLQAIRNSIKKDFGEKLTKKLQSSIKEFLTEEFQQGRLEMVDYVGDEIKFNQILQLVKV